MPEPEPSSQQTTSKFAAPPPPIPEVAAQYDQVRELRVEGHSAKEIATLTRLTISTVYR